jgi:hypothetical protein
MMRIDAFIIWGHGLPKMKDIIEKIGSNENFKILRIERYKPKNMRSFIYKIYSHDYAPYWHLRSKTKYLLKTQREVCFIFLENRSPMIEYYGEGKFRHKECKNIKILKEKIRDRFNPKIGDERSHDHVVHATDSPEQADQYMRLLGYKRGVQYFKGNHSFIKIPCYLQEYRKFEVKVIPTKLLLCSVATGESWSSYSTKICDIRQSPQYKFLTGDEQVYATYVNKFLGGPLKEYYNSLKFKTLFKNFQYLASPHFTSYVITYQKGGSHLILDGLHRATMHLVQGNENIKICQISK